MQEGENTHRGGFYNENYTAHKVLNDSQHINIVLN